ncbi:YggT family protein [Candidatus Berkiella aquae]|uniref:YGGT family protein n=1 Tax=Candidatus Berkiella aquae TaxID=295108 RepID=A0A0Q9YQJ7_9GAMM|nr:YggT family protein [Candidatus Berkiella aquae]MCS5712612.1 YggT family protein [Candidatus Berkiella aquae]
MSPLQNAGSFLIQSLFDIYLFVLLLRFILQYLRVDYYNPLTQFIVKATSPIVVPLRRFIPGLWGIDFATITAIILVTLLKITLITLVSMHKLPGPVGLMVWSVGNISVLTINLFFYAILANVLLSWIAPTAYSPVTIILQRLIEPLMRPARRYIPQIGGFDISPIPVMIALELLIILFADPLMQAGIRLATR